jgi:RNA polymerase-binding transcription factor DksA
LSGYIGNPDAEAEHALILAENGVASSQQMLKGAVLVYCLDCGDEIKLARRQAAQALGHTCKYCIECQPSHDKAAKVKMLDRIL